MLVRAFPLDASQNSCSDLRAVAHRWALRIRDRGRSLQVQVLDVDFNQPTRTSCSAGRALDLSRPCRGHSALRSSRSRRRRDQVEALPDGDMVRTWGPFDRELSAYYLSANQQAGIADFRAKKDAHPVSLGNRK